MKLKEKIAAVCAIGLLLMFASCSKEKLSELVDKTKEQVSAGADKVKQGMSAATDTAKEQLNLSGAAKLQLDAEIATSGCYAKFVTLGGGRPNVLQVRSYSSPEQESYPSMYLRLTTTAAGPSELLGQTLPGELFVQEESGGPIWTTPNGGQVEVKVLAVDDKKFEAEFVSGNLVNTQQPPEVAVKGTLSAVWQ